VKLSSDRRHTKTFTENPISGGFPPSGDLSQSIRDLALFTLGEISALPCGDLLNI
jgi:hypothetical protein